MSGEGVILQRMARKAKAVDTPLSRLLGSATALATLAQPPDGGDGTPQTVSPLPLGANAAAGSVAGDEDEEEEVEE